MFTQKEVEKLLEDLQKDMDPLKVLSQLPPAEKKKVAEMLLNEVNAAAPSEPAARPTDRRDSIKQKLQQFGLHK